MEFFIISGFFNNVNTESLLRNQFFALQKSDQSVYVPSSNSDLYNVNVVSKPVVQPHPDLFQKTEFKPFNPNVVNGGTQIFNNFTPTFSKLVGEPYRWCITNFNTLL